MILSCRKRPSGSFLARAYQIPANCEEMRAGLVLAVHDRPPGRGSGETPATAADTYSSLIEVLLDWKAAHPAIALGPGAAYCRQQHERPRPLHLAQESALRETRVVSAGPQDHSARCGRPRRARPYPSPCGRRSPPGDARRPGPGVRARGERGRRFIARRGGGRAVATALGERPRGEVRGPAGQHLHNAS